MVDEGGNEALCLLPDGSGGHLPLLAADDDKRDEVWRMGQQLAKASGRTAYLVSFDGRHDEAVIVP